MVIHTAVFICESLQMFTHWGSCVDRVIMRQEDALWCFSISWRRMVVFTCYALCCVIDVKLRLKVLCIPNLWLKEFLWDNVCRYSVSIFLCVSFDRGRFSERDLRGSVRGIASTKLFWRVQWGLAVLGWKFRHIRSRDEERLGRLIPTDVPPVFIGLCYKDVVLVGFDGHRAAISSCVSVFKVHQNLLWYGHFDTLVRNPQPDWCGQMSEGLERIMMRSEDEKVMKNSEYENKTFTVTQTTTQAFTESQKRLSCHIMTHHVEHKHQLQWCWQTTWWWMLMKCWSCTLSQGGCLCLSHLQHIKYLWRRGMQADQENSRCVCNDRRCRWRWPMRGNDSHHAWFLEDTDVKTERETDGEITRRYSRCAARDRTWCSFTEEHGANPKPAEKKRHWNRGNAKPWNRKTPLISVSVLQNSSLEHLNSSQIHSSSRNVHTRNRDYTLTNTRWRWDISVCCACME